MKWITSTTIKQWADTRSAQGLLPELILRLIRATSTNTSNIRFPPRALLLFYIFLYLSEIQYICSD